MEQRPALMDAFRLISLTPELAKTDWLRRPEIFIAALSGSLWQTHQIDAYHHAAAAMFAALPRGERKTGSAAPLLIAVLGQGAAKSDYPLFTEVRAQGLYARRLDETDAAEQLCSLVRSRAEEDGAAYAHWYVDGGEPWAFTGRGVVQAFTFPEMTPVRDAVLAEMDRAVREGAGPEILADRLREMRPSSLGVTGVAADARLDHLFMSLLTQGSGTQLYSTSFVQAAGVELVRRARPTTLLLRFAPRRKPASINDMLNQRGQSAEMDAEGALVDADMGLYYAWLALRQQPGGEQARMLAYVEGQGEAFVVGPRATRGAEITTPMTVQQAIKLL
jgi:hypothetical protein